MKNIKKKLFSMLININIFCIESFATLNAFTVIFNKLFKNNILNI